MKVTILAPTNIAALNINGETLDIFFKRIRSKEILENLLVIMLLLTK
jgi:hypothetical protein